MTDLVEKIRDAAEELTDVCAYYQRDQDRLDQTEKILDLAADKIEELEELLRVRKTEKPE